MLIKLNVALNSDTNCIEYSHPYKKILLNSWVGSVVRLSIQDHTTCLGCLRKTKIQRGYCFLCSRKLARCDLCFLNPHRCHFDQGTCREPEWAATVCNQDHIVYCSLTSQPKIGITKITQIPTRFIDQGAIWAKPLLKVHSRKNAGFIEKALIDEGRKGQTQWRAIILGKRDMSFDEVEIFYQDALRSAKNIAQRLGIEYSIWPNEPAFCPSYPVQSFVTKAISLPFPGTHEGILTGITAQYLLFGEDGAVNMRAYEGHNISLEKVDDRPEIGALETPVEKAPATMQNKRIATSHQPTVTVRGKPETISGKEVLLLGKSWAEQLPHIFEQPEMVRLREFLQEQYQSGTNIYPAKNQVFRAFQLTPLESLRIVIVGQDPYHGAGQAEGLCFSVPEGIPIPPSLRNIFKELHSDLNEPTPLSGSLVHWAKQGCFLINTRLTVSEGQPLSHDHEGWEFFTRQVFTALDKKTQPVLFVLLGGHAQKLKKYINNPIHEFLITSHPSPLSSYRGFFGSNLFSKMNAFLEHHSYPRINWTIQDPS